MAGVARQSHMGKVPMAPSLSPAYFSPTSLALFKSSVFPFSRYFLYLQICEMFGLQIGASVISSLSNSANPHTAPQRPKPLSSGAGSPAEISKSDTEATGGFTQGSTLLSASPFTPDPGNRVARNARDANTAGPIPASLASLASRVRCTAPPPAAVRCCGSYEQPALHPLERILQTQVQGRPLPRFHSPDRFPFCDPHTPVQHQPGLPDLRCAAQDAQALR